jgi:hypothetical protein
MEYPRVSFVILNWNGVRDTRDCLASLKKISYPNYEVIVVDNHSKGDDIAILQREYGSYIRIIQNSENLGFAGGNNVGIGLVLRESRSEYIMLLNNDTTVKYDFLEHLVKRARVGGDLGVIGPEIRSYQDMGLVQSRGGILSLYTGWRQVGGSLHPSRFKDQNKFTLKYYSGSALMIPTAVLKQVGAFDEQYFYYTEDVDLGYRIYLAGYKIVCVSEAIIYHKEAMSVGGNVRNPLTAYYETRNGIMFIRKHGNWFQRGVFIIGYLALLLINFILYYSQEKKVFTSRCRGVVWHFSHPVSGTPKLDHMKG